MFGGQKIVLFDDPGQLVPVLDTSLFKNGKISTGNIKQKKNT